MTQITVSTLAIPLAAFALGGCTLNVDADRWGDDTPSETGTVTEAASGEASWDFTDSTGKIKLRVKRCNYSSSQNYPVASCMVDSGWVLVGGGAEIQPTVAGAQLRGSHAEDPWTWYAHSAAGGSTPVAHKLRAYVVGMKLQGLSVSELRSNMQYKTTTTSEHFASACASEGYTVTGGGVQSLYPPVAIVYSWGSSNCWHGSTLHDGEMSAYAIAVKTCPTGVNYCLGRTIASKKKNCEDAGICSIALTTGAANPHLMTTSVGAFADFNRPMHSFLPVYDPAMGGLVRSTSPHDDPLSMKLYTYSIYVDD
jgi:hypothetical protein